MVVLLWSNDDLIFVVCAFARVQKNDGEALLKPGSTVEATDTGFKFGPVSHTTCFVLLALFLLVGFSFFFFFFFAASKDSSGKLVEVVIEKAEATKWVEALEPFTKGEATSEAAGDVLRQGWLTREKKKFFFVLRGGYLTWYNKEPNASIPHNKNFVKELTLNGCTVAQGAGGNIDLVKVNKTEKKEEKKAYGLVSDSADDAKAWVEALKSGIAIADEQGIGTGERSKAGLGARMKKGMAQKIATSKGGKSAAKKVLNAEVMGLLNALKKTIECYAGKERAEEMENNMIRVITKLYFAVDQKQVSIHDLLPADKFLREALKYVSLVWGGRYRNALTRGQPPAEKEALDKVVANMNKIEDLLIKSLSNVLQPKNIALIRATIAFFKDQKYLTFVVEDARLEEPRSKLGWFFVCSSFSSHCYSRAGDGNRSVQRS